MASAPAGHNAAPVAGHSTTRGSKLGATPFAVHAAPVARGSHIGATPRNAPAVGKLGGPVVQPSNFQVSSASIAVRRQTAMIPGRVAGRTGAYKYLLPHVTPFRIH